MPESYTCTETGRSFATAEEARASEARFREIQDACDSGGVPQLRPGDVIYLETRLYISHGCDDFCGGLAEVNEVREGQHAGKPMSYVRVLQELDSVYSWTDLAADQKTLRAEHGKNWAHPDPDLRPEHNGYFL